MCSDWHEPPKLWLKYAMPRAPLINELQTAHAAWWGVTWPPELPG